MELILIVFVGLGCGILLLFGFFRPFFILWMRRRYRDHISVHLEGSRLSTRNENQTLAEVDLAVEYKVSYIFKGTGWLKFCSESQGAEKAVREGLKMEWPPFGIIIGL